MNDADDLLRRCQRGDEIALEQLIRLFQDRAHRLAHRVLGESNLAEEATAEAFCKMWLRAGQWRGESSASTWIFQLTYRTILDLRKRRGRWWRFWQTSPGEHLVAPDTDPAQTAIESEQRRRIDEQLETALAELSEVDRALVHLYYLEEKSLPEIAIILDSTVAALKMRLSRARQKLRERFKDFDD